MAFESKRRILNNSNSAKSGVKDSEKRRTICLVVEDDEEVRKRLSAFLERSGYKSFEVGLGAEAIESYKKFKPDIVFLDVKLPDIDGLIVLKKIRAFDSAAKVCLFTGVNEESVISEAKKYGACGYLVKPVQIRDILKILKEL